MTYKKLKEVCYQPKPREINHPHYNVTKFHEKHQFDLLYVSQNIFEGNINKCKLTGVDVASRYKVARALRTKKASNVAFVFEAVDKTDDVFKYPKLFQSDKECEFKGVTKFLEKHMMIFEEKQQMQHSFCVSL